MTSWPAGVTLAQLEDSMRKMQGVLQMGINPVTFSRLTEAERQQYQLWIAEGHQLLAKMQKDGFDPNGISDLFARMSMR